MTTPTTPTPVTRYFQPGTSAVYFITTIASLAVPTIAEVTATTSQVLQADIAGIEGWMVEADNVAVPDFGKRFVGSVPGRINAADSKIDFYASATGADVRSIFTLGLNGYIAFFANGAVTGSAADYYKVTVSSVGRVRDMEAVPTLSIKFTIRDYSEGLLYPTV